MYICCLGFGSVAECGNVQPVSIKHGSTSSVSTQVFTGSIHSRSGFVTNCIILWIFCCIFFVNTHVAGETSQRGVSQWRGLKFSKHASSSEKLYKNRCSGTGLVFEILKTFYLSCKTLLQYGTGLFWKCKYVKLTTATNYCMSHCSLKLLTDFHLAQFLSLLDCVLIILCISSKSCNASKFGLSQVNVWLNWICVRLCIFWTEEVQFWT